LLKVSSYFRKNNKEEGYVFRKFFAWLCSRGNDGAIAGILLATSSGKDTRDLISERLNYKIKSEDSVSEINLKANDIMDDIQKKGE
jgi:hypothetical protein